jgi:cytochrome c5
METLYASTFNGLNAMPARGTCMSCSDDELKAAVDWMVEQVE